MSGLIPWGKRQFCDGNGNPLVGGWVAYCQVSTGGAVMKPIYGDEASTIQLQNPVPLDASGRPYSGGSQQSLWGDGQYEEFVYDSSGVLQTSSVIDTPLTDLLTGNIEIDGTLTVNGATTINGPLQVNGNTTTTGTDSAGTGQFGNLGVAGSATINGNATVAGALTAGDIYSNSDVNATGNLNGNNVNANSGTITNLNVPGTLNAGTINANQINAPGFNIPGIQTGLATITAQVIDGSAGGYASVGLSFSNSVSAVVVTGFSQQSDPTDDIEMMLVVRDVSNSGFVIHMINYTYDSGESFPVYWAAFGN